MNCALIFKYSSRSIYVNLQNHPELYLDLLFFIFSIIQRKQAFYPLLYLLYKKNRSLLYKKDEISIIQERPSRRQVIHHIVKV